MNRPMMPMRTAARHGRGWRRPTALVFRRPPRARVAAARPRIRAADQVSVTLAPRLTVVLQQYFRNADIVRQVERVSPAPVRETAATAGTIMNTVVHRHLTWSAAVLSRSADVRTDGRRGEARIAARRGRPARTRQIAPEAPTPVWQQPIAIPESAASEPPSRPAAPVSGPSIRTTTPVVRRPTRPGTDARVVAPARRRLIVEHERDRLVAGVVRTHWRIGPRQSETPEVARTRTSRSRVDLADAGSAPRRAPRVEPVATVYRQEQAVTTSAPASTRESDAKPPATLPRIDIDHLDRELWRRFEKRARTERERHGRA